MKLSVARCRFKSKLIGTVLLAFFRSLFNDHRLSLNGRFGHDPCFDLLLCHHEFLSFHCNLLYDFIMHESTTLLITSPATNLMEADILDTDTLLIA